MDVFIKNVDEKSYKVAKILAVKHDKPVGSIVSEAIRLLARQEKKKGLGVLTPVSFGEGTENLSTEVDRILYG